MIGIELWLCVYAFRALDPLANIDYIFNCSVINFTFSNCDRFTEQYDEANKCDGERMEWKIARFHCSPFFPLHVTLSPFNEKRLSMWKTHLLPHGLRGMVLTIKPYLKQKSKTLNKIYDGKHSFKDLIKKHEVRFVAEKFRFSTNSILLFFSIDFFRYGLQYDENIW